MISKHSAIAIAALLCGASLSTTALAQSAPAAFTTATRYDNMHRVTGQIHPSANGTAAPFLAVRTTYDAAGRVIRVENGSLAAWQDQTVAPMNWSGFTVFNQIDTVYDSAGRKIEQVQSSAGTVFAVTQFSYDVLSRLVCTAVRMNPASFPSVGSGGVTGGSLPSSACVLGVAGTQGPDRITQSLFDPITERLTQVRKAVGTSVEAAYETYTYTASGKQQDVVDANGNHTLFAYDGFDRLQFWYFPSTAVASSFNNSAQIPSGGLLPYAITTANAADTTDYEAYTYDNNGNRTSLRKRDGTVVTYTYDALNRMTGKSVPQRAGLPATDARSVNYTYDIFGHLTAAAFADQNNGITEGVTNTYDTLGRLLSTKLTMDGAGRLVSFCYDADGNRTVMSYPDSTVGACPIGTAAPTGWTNYVNYAYDGLDRAASVTTSAGTTPASYTYNTDGTRATYASNGAALATSYSYDAVDRLAGLTNTPADTGYGDNFGFSYNPASQITQLTKSNNAFVYTGSQPDSRAYVTNGLNQYSSVKGIGFSYDANGNLTSDGAGTTFLYDVENRMVAASNSTTGQVGATMRYDPLGRLYEAVNTSTGAATRFVYGGDELLAEYDGNGNLLRRYVHGPDLKADEPIAWYEGASFSGASERLLRPNWQGSIELATDTTGGSVYAANTYDEYGMPGSSNAGRFQYTGQAWLAEAKLYYYKARMYSPVLGRFMQTDPIEYKDDIDLYAYVNNDPVDKTDFSGECPFCVPLVIGAVEAAEGTAVVGTAAAGAEVATAGTVAGTATVAGEGAGAASAANSAATVYRGSTLARNMAAAGNAVTKGIEHAHHIVAQAAKAAAPARATLARVGIKVHDAVNGAAVKIEQHVGAHTKEYYEMVNKAVGEAEAGGKSAVEKALQEIGKLFK